MKRTLASIAALTCAALIGASLTAVPASAQKAPDQFAVTAGTGSPLSKDILVKFPQYSPFGGVSYQGTADRTSKSVKYANTYLPSESRPSVGDSFWVELDRGNDTPDEAKAVISSIDGSRYTLKLVDYINVNVAISNASQTKGVVQNIVLLRNHKSSDTSAHRLPESSSTVTQPGVYPFTVPKAEKSESWGTGLHVASRYSSTNYDFLFENGLNGRSPGFVTQTKTSDVNLSLKNNFKYGNVTVSRDKKGGLMKKATVSLYSESGSFLVAGRTDSKGKATLKNVPVGRYSAGFEVGAVYKNVTVSAGKTSKVTLTGSDVLREVTKGGGYLKVPFENQGLIDIWTPDRKKTMWHGGSTATLKPGKYLVSQHNFAHYQKVTIKKGKATKVKLDTSKSSRIKLPKESSVSSVIIFDSKGKRIGPAEHYTYDGYIYGLSAGTYTVKYYYGGDFVSSKVKIKKSSKPTTTKVPAPKSGKVVIKVQNSAKKNLDGFSVSVKNTSKIAAVTNGSPSVVSDANDVMSFRLPVGTHTIYLDDQYSPAGKSITLKVTVKKGKTTYKTVVLK